MNCNVCGAKLGDVEITCHIGRHINMQICIDNLKMRIVELEKQKRSYKKLEKPPCAEEE